MPALRQAATAFAAAYCDPDTQAAVALAVTEACTNVVRHAYPDVPGHVTLTARLDGADLVFEITDHGTGLVPSSTTGGLGMGLEVMRRLAAAHITSTEHGTRVELRFPRNSPSSNTT